MRRFRPHPERERQTTDHVTAFISAIPPASWPLGPSAFHTAPVASRINGAGAVSQSGRTTMQLELREKKYFDERATREMAQCLHGQNRTVQEILTYAAVILAMTGQEAGLAGQVSARSEWPRAYWTLRFGSGLDEATPDNLIEVDADQNTIQPVSPRRGIASKIPCLRSPVSSSAAVLALHAKRHSGLQRWFCRPVVFGDSGQLASGQRPIIPAKGECERRGGIALVPSAAIRPERAPSESTANLESHSDSVGKSSLVAAGSRWCHDTRKRKIRSSVDRQSV